MVSTLKQTFLKLVNSDKLYTNFMYEVDSDIVMAADAVRIIMWK